VLVVNSTADILLFHPTLHMQFRFIILRVMTAVKYFPSGASAERGLCRNFGKDGVVWWPPDSNTIGRQGSRGCPVYVNAEVHQTQAQDGDNRVSFSVGLASTFVLLEESGFVPLIGSLRWNQV